MDMSLRELWELVMDRCGEPAQEFLPMTKVMQRGLICKGKGLICKGAPWICLNIYPKNRICLFYYFTTFTNSSDINGGYPRPPFSKGIQLRALVN